MNKLIINKSTIRLENNITAIEIDFENEENINKIFNTTNPSEEQIKEYLNDKDK